MATRSVECTPAACVGPANPGDVRTMRIMRVPGALVILAAIFICAAPAVFSQNSVAEDRIELVNGTVYTGRIIAMDELTVTIVTDNRERIIDRSVVASGSFGPGSASAGTAGTSGTEGSSGAGTSPAAPGSATSATDAIADQAQRVLQSTRPDLAVTLSQILSGTQAPEDLLLWLPFEGQVQDRSRYRRAVANNGAGLG